jgi:tRNA-dihydrouridine synthase 1
MSFIFLRSGRRTWFSKFRAALAATTTLDAIESLLRFKVERWRGRPPRKLTSEDEEDQLCDSGSDDGKGGLSEELPLDLEALSFAS